MDDILTWDDCFPIACALKALYPNVKLEDVSLQQIFDWTIALPGFSDEPALANENILMAIYREWYEEVNPI